LIPDTHGKIRIKFTLKEITMYHSVITGSGAFIPTEIVTNAAFEQHEFYNEDGTRIDKPTHEIVERLESITGIRARRYAKPELRSSDMAIIAARRAVEDAKIDPETIDQIIVAHNFGDILSGTLQTDILPSIASRVKFGLGINNVECIPYDVIFGCPGWIQGLIQADAFFKAGIAKKALVIGTETLSRIVDPHDRDAMIFSDGAGATVVEYLETDGKKGILASSGISHAREDTYFLYMGSTNKPDITDQHRYIKMHGRKIYEYALTHVPAAMKACLDKAGVKHIREVQKIFIHQANEKMDEAIIKRLFRLYDEKTYDPEIAPMNIHDFGNNSVATIPTMFDMVRKSQLGSHELRQGDLLLFASVGAGMNINALAYRY
jgi:3-oxoacyl-[acyl-carrier-protein] synthase-3